MDAEIKKEILYDLHKTIEILQVPETKDLEELKTLSDHSIEDIAVHKDLELVSVTVLLYSIYKIVSIMQPDDYQELLLALQSAEKSLQQNNLGRYNSSLKRLYSIVRRTDTAVQEHLQDVMQAARIKKGTALLQRGLSIGQAAGLMGLSNWDLQPYAGRTTALEQHDEIYPAQKRMAQARHVFGVR